MNVAPRSTQRHAAALMHEIMGQSPTAEPKVSALSQTVTKDGWKLDIVIFESGDGGWLLEIGDGDGSGTHWTEPFATEQEALDTALKAIEVEGVAAFTHPQPWRNN